ncbi:MAG TPA: aminodeoxychorismate synthase component I [Pyrinomonadaceae bacterium]|nr:aminodeoxychorismate synthase component I [Pyrinomonadaceae bacterium]
MPSVLFGDDASPHDWRFSAGSPTEILLARTLSEVIPLLRRVEAVVAEGAHAVVLLSYEAAPAFDIALTTHPASDFPCALAAIFPNSTSTRDELTAGAYQLSDWKPLVTLDQYERSISRIRDLIAQGYTYQVNYTLPLVCDFAGDPEAWYRDLYKAQPAPYSTYLDLGRYKILSLSPELFFLRKGDSVTTMPMKGTARRGRWLQEDLEIADRLSNSEKDRAENVMIVDLLRNDLGKISQPGSVRVSRLFELERYDTVWQMTSTVESSLSPQVGLTEMLAALFPCGSITGAPKIRTMEIIRDLELAPRNIFTGTIGLIKPGGDCCFNVAIRTVLLDSHTGRATFGVGGGITFDSTAAGEYDECLAKAAFLNRAHPDFQLLESMLLEDGDLFLLNRHLVRLRESSSYFGFKFSEDELAEQLLGLRETHRSGKWKVRLLLSKEGQTTVDVTALPSSPPVSRRVKLASFAVEPTQRFLFHKTTHRIWYDRAFAEKGDGDDVILWNDRGELTESTIANVVVSLDGKLFTPPRSAGLLAGTFREELLGQKKIYERTIHKEELKPGDSFYLVNSVQKWMPAVLIND